MVIRRAGWRDLWWLWKLRNLPDVIATSESGRGVGWWEHVRWWWRVGRHYPLFLCYVVGCRVGMVRLDEDGRVSVAVLPAWHRQGVGRYLLEYLTMVYRRAMIARIHFDNEPSRLLFHRAGFHYTHRDGPWYVYRYDPKR